MQSLTFGQVVAFVVVFLVGSLISLMRDALERRMTAAFVAALAAVPVILALALYAVLRYGR